MSNTRNDIAKRLGLAQPNARPGAGQKVMKKPPTEFDLEDACWDGYEAVGTKKKDGKTVPNCVPKAKSSRPGNAAKFATPEQIKERYKQLRAMPKQRLFDIWTRETLGRIHNADIKEQDKLNMAVDLIRSEYERKDWEAAGFKINSSRPGAKAKFLRIDPNSINSWEIQRGRKITSAGKGTWAFTDPYGKLVIVPIVGTFKEAVAWLNKNGDYKGSNDYYKVEMSRPGAKVKFGYEKTVTLLLEDAGIDSAEFDFRDGVLLVSPSIDGNAVKKALQDAIKSGKITKAPQVKRSNFSRLGAKAKMAEPLPTRPIGSGKNRYLIYHQAVAEEIEQIKQMRNGIIYLREQLSNAKSDMNGAIASFMKVKEFEDEAKAKAQFQNAENEFKQAKEKVQYYLKQVRFSRPGVKVK